MKIPNIRYCIYRSVLGLALGLFLLINPEGSLNTLIRLISFILIISGLFSLYFAWQRGEEAKNLIGSKRRNDNGLQRLLILNAFVCVVFAILLFAFPSVFTGLSMFMVGIVLILSSGSQLMGAISFKKKYQVKLPWYLYISPIFILILGVVILFNPFQTAISLTIFAGIICILYAFLEILQAISEYRLYKQFRQ